MAQNDVLDYIRKTPYNSNVNVVKGMLNAEGGDDTTIEALSVTENGTYTAPEGKAYSPVTVDVAGGGPSWTVLTEETVITEEGGGVASADLSYSQLIDADTIRVTFNGTEYVCSNVTEEDGGVYGAVDGWSTYPFLLESDTTPFGVNTSITTETAGTYTIKIEVPAESSSSDFSTAEVTIVNAGTFGDVFGSMPICHEAGELAPEGPAIIESTFSVEPEATNVFTVPIYQNGVLDAAFDSSVQIISVAGEAEWESSDTDVFIAGDCTITASIPE